MREGHLASHFIEHKRRFLSIGPKLVRFLRSDTFANPQSCSDRLDALLLLARRDGRFQTEKVQSYSAYGDEPNPFVHGTKGWWAEHPDWQVLYRETDPESIQARGAQFLERCIRKKPRR